MNHRLPPDWKVGKLHGEGFENLIVNVPKLRGEELPRAQQRFQSGVLPVPWLAFFSSSKPHYRFSKVVSFWSFY
jgi:hypothetical protein